MPFPHDRGLTESAMSGKDQGCHTPELPPLSGDTGPPPRRVFVFLGCEVSPIIPNHAGYIGSGDSDRGCASTILALASPLARYFGPGAALHRTLRTPLCRLPADISPATEH